MEIFNKEEIYDDEISPLVKQILAICNNHGIPMVASFTFENCPERGPGRCTTLINNIPDRSDNVLQQANSIIRKGGHVTFGIAIGKSI